MVARTPSITHTEQIVVTPAVEKKRVDFAAAVSTSDTVPIGQLSSILGAGILKKSDGSTVAFTKATNILTITEVGLTDEPVVGFAYGT